MTKDGEWCAWQSVRGWGTPCLAVVLRRAGKLGKATRLPGGRCRGGLGFLWRKPRRKSSGGGGPRPPRGGGGGGGGGRAPRPDAGGGGGGGGVGGGVGRVCGVYRGGNPPRGAPPRAPPLRKGGSFPKNLFSGGRVAGRLGLFFWQPACGPHSGRPQGEPPTTWAAGGRFSCPCGENGKNRNDKKKNSGKADTPTSVPEGYVLSVPAAQSVGGSP